MCLVLYLNLHLCFLFLIFSLPIPTMLSPAFVSAKISSCSSSPLHTVAGALRLGAQFSCVLTFLKASLQKFNINIMTHIEVNLHIVSHCKQNLELGQPCRTQFVFIKFLIFCIQQSIQITTSSGTLKPFKGLFNFFVPQGPAFSQLELGIYLRALKTTL